MIYICHRLPFYAFFKETVRAGDKQENRSCT
jgi:hypothetical protein